MNKLKIKQIYLLSIAIFGIIAVSIYSTYAIFTLETKSDNIVTIHTPDNLEVSSSTYEYKQVSVPKDSYITTDIDLYNNFDYELCYSIWYKIVGNIDNSKIKIYENSIDSLTTSSTISSVTSKRINLIIINDNETDAKVNIGVAFSKNEGTCELNITNDKSLITSLIDAKSLSETLIKETKVNNIEANYLTYKDKTTEIELSEEKTYYISNEFTYKDEIFTLKDALELNIKDLDKDEVTNYQNYYLCEDTNSCRNLYHINEMNNNKITKYNILIGYLDGENGLRKVNNNYYYYGDNPNNFIYYNCTNESDTKTCELWRIVGFIYDDKENKYLTKIIKNDYLDSQIFDTSNNIWNNSNISKYLNEEYKLKNDGMIYEYTFKEENIVNIDSNLNSIPLLNEENKNKIMLMNVSDYLYASVCKKDKLNEYDTLCLNNNWLNKYEDEWTMTTKFENSYVNEETKEPITPDNNKVYSVGASVIDANINELLNVRPVIYLKPRVLLTNGDGTLDNPYIIR